MFKKINEIINKIKRNKQIKELLKGSYDIQKRIKKLEYDIEIEEANINYEESNGFIAEPCKNCPNNPKNGGSGICHCILGLPKIT